MEQHINASGNSMSVRHVLAAGAAALLLLGAVAFFERMPPRGGALGQGALASTLIGNITAKSGDSITIVSVAPPLPAQEVQVTASTTIFRQTLLDEKTRSRLFEKLEADRAKAGTSTYIMPPDFSTYAAIALQDLAVGDAVSVDIATSSQPGKVYAKNITIVPSLPNSAVPPPAQ